MLRKDTPAAGLEPATICTLDNCATQLRHADYAQLTVSGLAHEISFWQWLPKDESHFHFIVYFSQH